jgi:type I restriction enzyme S subunit
MIAVRDFRALNRSFELCPGDVVMAIVGATLGKVALVEDIGPFQIQRSLAVFRTRPNLMLPEFLQEHLWQSVAFSAQPGIYLGFLADVSVLVPPHREQERICEALRKDIAPIDAAIDRAQREIVLLRDYRNRLVTDVLTGQVDVRDAARIPPDDEGDRLLFHDPESDVLEEREDTEGIEAA